jgi:hypothetical protein
VVRPRENAVSTAFRILSDSFLLHVHLDSPPRFGRSEDLVLNESAFTPAFAARQEMSSATFDSVEKSPRMWPGESSLSASHKAQALFPKPLWPKQRLAFQRAPAFKRQLISSSPHFPGSASLCPPQKRQICGNPTRTFVIAESRRLLRVQHAPCLYVGARPCLSKFDEAFKSQLVRRLSEQPGNPPQISAQHRFTIDF